MYEHIKKNIPVLANVRCKQGLWYKIEMHQDGRQATGRLCIMAMKERVCGA